MELTEYRKEFDIHFLAPQISGIEKSITFLKQLGHRILWSENHPSFRVSFSNSPSHLVILHLLTMEGNLEDFLLECLTSSPKCLFIVVGLPSQSNIIKTYFDYGVLAFVEMGETIDTQMAWAVDLVLERAIYQFQNEVLLEDTRDLNIKLKASREACEKLAGELQNYKEQESEAKLYKTTSAEWLKLLSGALAPRSKEEIVQNFMNSAGPGEDLEVKGLYFKYLPQIQTFIATHCLGMDVERTKGIGIRLQPDQAKNLLNVISDSKGFSQLSELMSSGFYIHKYFISPICIRDDIEGLFVFWADDLTYFYKMDFECKLQFFKLALERYIYQRRAMELELRDTVTQLIGSEEFTEILSEEILRAKKQQGSVAIIKFSIDQLNSIEEQYGEPVRDGVLKHMASLVKKMNRLNDSMYRTAINEFTIVLPNINYREAMFRAEKLRRLVESTPMPTLSMDLTVSLGISEYPSLTNQSEQMARGAIQAMAAVIERGGNKVGIARAPVNYKPEFIIKDNSLEQEL